MAKKDFSNSLEAVYDELAETTKKILKEGEEARAKVPVKVCLRIPKDLLVKLKIKKLNLEAEGKKTSIQDLIVEAIAKSLEK